MSDRVDIRVSEDVKETLREHKRDGETWNALCRRAAQALDGQASGGQYPAPRCTNCGATANEWTVEDGQLVCPQCADGDVVVEYDD